MNRIIRVISIVVLALSGVLSSSAIRINKSMLNKDSIAAMGKFPRFCLNAVDWYNRTFNTYDTLYVGKNSKQFAVYPVFEGWTDSFRFKLDDDTGMTLYSPLYLSLGAKAHLLMVDVGHQWTLNDQGKSRRRWSFGFNTNMFELRLNWTKNNAGMTLNKFMMEDETLTLKLPFRGFNSRAIYFDGIYYFNYKRYSRSAAFAPGLVQKRNSGSPLAGFRFERHDIRMNLLTLYEDLMGEPTDESTLTEEELKKYKARMVFNNYLLTGGYGYNIVLPKGFVIGLWDAFSLGLAQGRANNEAAKYNAGISNTIKFGLGWGIANWYTIIQTSWDQCYYNERKFSISNGYYTFSVTAGYRFSIW